MTEEEKIKEYLESVGVTHIRYIPNQGWCGLIRFLYTIGLCCNMKTETDGDFYQYRYCYKTYDEALHAISKWNGISHPPGNWIKRKGEYEISGIEFRTKRKLVGRIMASFLPNKEFKFHSFKNNTLLIKKRYTNKIIELNWIESKIIFSNNGVGIGEQFISFNSDDIDRRKPKNHPMIQKIIDNGDFNKG